MINEHTAITDKRIYDEIADIIRDKLGMESLIDPNDMPALLRTIQGFDFRECPDLVPTSTDVDGNIYNGCGYKEGYRLNSSGGETALANHFVAGYIPVDFTGNKIMLITGLVDYIGWYDDTHTPVAMNGGCINSKEKQGNTIIVLGETSVENLSYAGYGYNIFTKAKYIRASAYGKPPVIKIMEITAAMIKV